MNNDSATTAAAFKIGKRNMSTILQWCKHDGNAVASRRSKRWIAQRGNSLRDRPARSAAIIASIEEGGQSARYHRAAIGAAACGRGDSVTIIKRLAFSSHQFAGAC